jgi:ketosteroid isomerase-like protein
MNVDTSNIETVRAIYAAMGSGDIASLFGYIAPDCVIVQDARLPWGGRFVGHDGFATFGLRLRENIESKVTTSAMFAADGDVIQVGKTAGTTIANKTAFEIDEVHRWTIRDGRAVAAHFSIDTPAMLAALGSAD